MIFSLAGCIITANCKYRLQVTFHPYAQLSKTVWWHKPVDAKFDEKAPKDISHKDDIVEWHMGRKWEQSAGIWLAALNFWRIGVFHVWKTFKGATLGFVERLWNKRNQTDRTCVKSVMTGMFIRSCTSVSGAGYWWMWKVNLTMW